MVKIRQAPTEDESKSDSANSPLNLTAETQQWVVLAQLLRPQGRKGEILAELLTDFPERFEDQKRVFLAPAGFSGPESAARVAEVASFWLPLGRNEGRIVLHLSGIDSINDAEPLSGLEVIVPATERRELEEDSSYISDLVGCTLIDLANEGTPVSVGMVTDVHFATTPDGNRRLSEAAPLLAVETPEGDEVLVPFVKAFIRSLNPEAKRIEMSLPPGLLEVNRPS